MLSVNFYFRWLAQKMQLRMLWLYDKNIERIEKSFKFYNNKTNKTNVIIKINLSIKSHKSHV